ncbi:MAG: ABC transporter ATP-binding protein [Candidatus Thorarchaeota archaeon]|nr:MAG: ABC transporter ATP-binding protein [Candidatus Thorarchaeota archaeon]RLI57105.1 MAG: ABC transporter ATP-binding protein [Candidatus Thorarchaeota archaeon]
MAGAVQTTIAREDVERLKARELLHLARLLDVPMSARSIRREWLIDSIMDEIINRDLVPAHKELHTPAINIKGLKKKYGRTLAVSDLDLQVNPGEIVGLVGPNGAGKSTTLRVLTGIIRPTAGEVFVNGHDMLNDPLVAKESIGYIPERPTCYPSLTVREYVMFVARIYDVPGPVAIVRMRAFVDLFHMQPYLDTYIGTLSKGNLQRTLLIGIFTRIPPYVLALDEPIYGLDPRGAWNLKAHLRRLKAEGSAILISTHILQVAADLCDRFIIMNEGSVVGSGTLDELMSVNSGARNLEEVFLALTGGIPEE